MTEIVTIDAPLSPRLQLALVAWLDEHQAAKLSEIQRRLGHKNIATTSLYLQALGREENPLAVELEQLLGVVG